MSATTIVEGVSLALRIGYAPHTGRMYLTPQATLEEFLRYSNAHKRKFLYTDNRNGASIKSKIDLPDHLILFSPKADFKLIGDIFLCGKDYDPSTWQSEYNTPEPWCRMPARYWYMIRNLRLLTDFKWDDYETIAPQRDPIRMSDELANERRIAIYRIQPHG